MRPSGRLGSIDAYRGFVMLLMLAEALRLCQVSAALPESVFWRWLCYHQCHVEWVGCSLHDLIQPGFSFLVGAALPFSIFRRRAQGDSFRQLARHAGLRSVLLIIVGMMIMALYSEWRLNWHLEDTLSQIGLAFPFVFLLALRPARDQWMAVAILLAGWWLWFACSPRPGPDFDYARVGMNALVAYSLAHLFPIMAFNSFRRIFGTKIFRVFGGAYEPVMYGVVVLSASWVFLYLLYRRKLFIRV